MGLATIYIDLARLVKSAEGGDGVAAWQAFAELHEHCEKFPADTMFRDMFARLLPIVAARAMAIVCFSAEPHAANSRGALTALKRAVGIDGQRHGLNVQRAARAKTRGERAAWSAVHREMARAILEGRAPKLPTQAQVIAIAAKVAGVDRRTARGYDLPQLPTRAAPVLEGDAASHKHPVRRMTQKPKSWRKEL